MPICAASRHTVGAARRRTWLARRYFEEAVALDPEFARAYAGLALTYSREAIDGWTPSRHVRSNWQRSQADKAAELDSSCLQVHFVIGQVRLFQRLHTEAVAAAERAIDVDPNYADAFALLAWTLNYAGRPTKAMSALNMAMRLNPRPPASYLEILGEIYFVQGRYEDSASTFQQVLDRQSRLPARTTLERRGPCSRRGRGPRELGGRRGVDCEPEPDNGAPDVRLPVQGPPDRGTGT